MAFTSTVSPSLKIGLQFFGALPDMPNAVVNRLLYVSSALVVQYFQYLYLFAHCKPGELQNLVESLPSTLDYSLTIIKLMTLWKYHREIREIMAVMDTDWRECVNVDRHLYLMTRKASISHFWANAMIAFNTLAGVFYVMGDTAIATARLADNDTSRPFPVKILFPFEAERSPIYELLVVVLFVHVMLTVYAITVVNALLSTLVLHASGQIDIIREKLKTIAKEVSYYKSSGHTIAMLIERHNRVISFSGNIDKLFSFITLAQVLLNTIVICALALVFITSVDATSVALIRCVISYCAIISEIFIICFVGEYLSFQGKSLAYAAYDSLWYNMLPNRSKSILFVIMRSQRQLTITVGGMTNLSLEAFASIMKASASYVSVLRAMY